MAINQNTTQNTLHIATVASDTVWKEAAKNVKAAESHIEKALDLYPSTQIVMFPEISLMGFVVDHSNQDIAESLEGKSVNAVKELAKKYNIAIIASMIEKGKDRPYNTTFAIAPNGSLLASYRKNHLFSDSAEPDVFAPGEELSTFDYQGWKCGLATCFDIRFPRLFETYNRAGVECVFSVFNWVAGRNKPELFKALIKTRAHENQYFVAGIDRSGSDPNTSYHGLSVISNPYGEDLSNSNGIYACATLDKADITSLRTSLPLAPSFRSSYTIKQN